MADTKLGGSFHGAERGKCWRRGDGTYLLAAATIGIALSSGTPKAIEEADPLDVVVVPA